MKRPASARASTAKRFRAGPSKEDRCRTLSDALAGFEELPEVVRSMLAGLVVPGFANKETDRHPYQTVAVEMLTETLENMDASLSEKLKIAQQRVDGAEIDRQTREERLCLAEAHLVKVKEELAAKREEMFGAEEAVEQATRVLTSKEAEQRDLESRLHSNMAKLGQLEVAEQNVFRPFVQTQAGGPQAGKCLRDLRKVGKDFGFHDVLMNSIPDILRKEPERRQTFDALALKQMEVEFSRHISSHEAIVRESQQEILTCATAVQEAKAAQAAAVESRNLLARGMAEADARVVDGKDALEAARRHLRDFKKDARGACDAVKSCKAKLDAFRAGPVNAFKELGGPWKSPVPSLEVLSKDGKLSEEVALSGEEEALLCETKVDTLQGSEQA
eukprot:TRINITY_DN106888_c0_g1_i1.p1 TRINITY_DN106888_c0_g1~~TRINITY_DN106888_c0_g1_i1.p1  ORF type:complete len:416 (-),score=127.91 TRINITY_DN106888_c0_g1_i1:254-1420(-)